MRGPTLRSLARVAIAMGIGLSPAAARAQPSAVIVWLERPSPEDVRAVYPDMAQRLGLEGRATMRCRIDRDGHLEHCVTIQEDPPHKGFGEAARKLAPRFLISSNASGAEITIPIHFVMGHEGEPVAPAEKGPGPSR